MQAGTPPRYTIVMRPAHPSSLACVRMIVTSVLSGEVGLCGWEAGLLHQAGHQAHGFLVTWSQDQHTGLASHVFLLPLPAPPPSLPPPAFPYLPFSLLSYLPWYQACS